MRGDLQECIWVQEPLFLFFLNKEMFSSCDSFLKNTYFYLFIWLHHLSWISLVAQMVKNLPASLAMLLKINNVNVKLISEFSVLFC